MMKTVGTGRDNIYFKGGSHPPGAASYCESSGLPGFIIFQENPKIQICIQNVPIFKY